MSRKESDEKDGAFCTSTIAAATTRPPLKSTTRRASANGPFIVSTLSSTSTSRSTRSASWPPTEESPSPNVKPGPPGTGSLSHW